MALPEDLLRKMVAETIGTFMLVFIGTGAILAGGSYVLAFGFGLMAIVYTIGNISGAHVNPAVTLSLAVVGRFPMAQVPYYWLSQVLGALLASAVLRLVHGNIMNLGATQVAEGYSLLDGFLIELIATALFLFVITAVATDKRAHPAIVGLAIGSALLVVQLFAGNVSGGSVNPARSLAPALISGNFSDLWIYLIAPFIGAVIGVVGYEFIRGEQEGSPTRMAPNLKRVTGGQGGPGGSRGSQRRPQPQPRTDDYAPDEIIDDAPQPRRSQRPPQAQRQQRPPVEQFDDDVPPQRTASRPPADPYDADVPPRRPQRPSADPYDTDLPPERPPQRRRPPQQ